MVVALLTLGGVTTSVPRLVVTTGVAGTCAVMVVLAVIAIGDGHAASLVLPVGPVATVHLALDPLAASFLLLLFLTMPYASTAPMPLAATGIIILAGDGLTLAVGLLLLGGLQSLKVTSTAVVCVLVALALAGQPAEFTALNGAQPEAWRGAAVVLLLLAAAGIQSWVSPAIAGYLVLRVLVDLPDTMEPWWWLLLLAGATASLAGSLRSAIAEAMDVVAAALSLPLFGMALTAIGAALLAHTADLPSVGSRALEAAWLALVGHVLCRTLLLLIANAVEAGAGTRWLGRLGGLIHPMPLTAGCCLVGLFAVAIVPPGLGFAAFWLLFQSLVAATRIGGLGPQVLVVSVAAAAALSVGLSAFAGVRLFGVVFLGRPRSPRAAAAEEAPQFARYLLGSLAGGIALLGLLPSLALLAEGWFGTAKSLSLLTLSAGVDDTGYSPIAVAGLLGLADIVVIKSLRRTSEPRREPPWAGGFAPPPSWLPFGDPATQFGPGSFAQPLQAALASLPRLAIRRICSRGCSALLRAATSLMMP